MRTDTSTQQQDACELAAAAVSRRDFIRDAAAAAVGIGAVSLAGCARAGAATSPQPVTASQSASITAAQGDSATATQAASTAASSSDAADAQASGPNSTYNPGNALALYANPLATTQDERVENAKRVLVVVDYQVDFVDGVFGHIDTAIAIEDGLCEIIKEYQDAGDIVIYTMDTHPSDLYAYTREGNFNPPHCIPGTDGWELYGKVKDLLTPQAAIQVKKGTYGSKDLVGVIQGIIDQGTAIKSIEMAGVSTTCRVLHNAIILYNYFPEVEMIMDAKTTASYTDEKTREQLEELEGWGFVVKW